jgi:VWFA-related protein
VRTMRSGRMISIWRLMVFGFGVALLSAQQGPTFRTVTKLVEVTVTVLDKDGKAAAGLKADDFMLFDDGEPRPVELFRFDGGRPEASTGAAAAVSPPGMFTNRLSATDNTLRNVTALVLDTINTPPEQNTIARAQVMQYLRTLAPQTVIAVFLMGRQLRILHDFTDDAAALRARIEKTALAMPAFLVTDYNRSILEAELFLNIFKDEPAEETWEGVVRNILEVEAMANAAARRARMEQSLMELEALGTHLAGIPGRKNVVWIGGGFSMAAVTGNMGMGQMAGTATGRHATVERFDDTVQKTSRRLAQQGIVLYVVDSSGIDLPDDRKAESRRTLPLRGQGRFAPQMETEAISSDTYPAMGMMASITGGRFLHHTNDLTSGFKQVAADLQGSYTLGFYMPGDPDNKWHKLKVRVKRSDFSVRHREGYQADSNLAPAKWTEEAWLSAISNPVGSSAIPLTVMCKWTSLGELAVTVLAETTALRYLPDRENLKADLEILIGDRTADGLARANRSAVTRTIPMAQWEAVRLQQTRYNGIWKPATNATGLRVIVHDVNSGQYGSLDVPLSKVPRNNPN